MAQSSQTSCDQVLVECSSLPPSQRNDLQAFLERQPEVHAVTRTLHVSEALMSPDTIGLVVPHFDLVVHLGECPMSSTVAEKDDRAALILKKVAEWTIAHTPRE